MNQSLIQGSEEWKKLRRSHITATDLPVLMGLSPWSTPYQLWQEKLGLKAPKEVNQAMQRGLDLESTARDIFVEKRGISVSPKVVFHGIHNQFMASLDGISGDGKIIVEIKCPGKSAHDIALSGKIPEHYYPQLQWQIACADTNKAFYLSYDGQTSTIIEVPRNDEYIVKLYKEAHGFYECMTSFEPPALCQRDYREETSPEAVHLIGELREAEDSIKALETRKEEIRKTLIRIADGQNMSIGNAKLSKNYRRGSVEYAKIPALIGVDLDQYRKTTTEYWRINL